MQQPAGGGRTSAASPSEDLHGRPEASGLMHSSLKKPVGAQARIWSCGVRLWRLLLSGSKSRPLAFATVSLQPDVQEQPRCITSRRAVLGLARSRRGFSDQGLLRGCSKGISLSEGAAKKKSFGTTGKPMFLEELLCCGFRLSMLRSRSWRP